MKTWVQVHAKTCVAFIAGFFLPALWQAVNNPAAGFLPAVDDYRGWATLLASAFISAVGVYLKRNALTPDQIAHGYKALPEHDQQAVVAAVKPADGLTDTEQEADRQAAQARHRRRVTDGSTNDG